MYIMRLRIIETGLKYTTDVNILFGKPINIYFSFISFYRTVMSLNVATFFMK